MSTKRINESSDAPRKKQNTLDSDEEDESVDKYEILDEEDIEGEEPETIDFDGDLRITPFNMKEELEEGHFDTEGNYYFNKDEEIRDNWLDNIDWVRVKNVNNNKGGGGNNSKTSDGEDGLEDVDRKSVYVQMLELMKPGENVARALKRFGGSSTGGSASSKWLKNKKKKGHGSASEADSGASSSEEAKENLLRLTELADRLVHIGDLEIYHETYEKLQHFVARDVNKTDTEAKTATKPVVVADDDLDMFGESFEEKKTAHQAMDQDGKADETEKKVDGGQVTGNKTVSFGGGSGDSDLNPTSAVTWEFKWENTDAAEIHGPHSTQEMQRWIEEDYFPNGVFVRRADKENAPFYNSKRIDFDLYD